MNPMKSTLMIALVTGMILLAVLGFNLTTVHAHGHGGGGHGGGGQISEDRCQMSEDRGQRKEGEMLGRCEGERNEQLELVLQFTFNLLPLTFCL